MRIAISGATGLVGSALARALRAEGSEVVRLVRRDPEQADILWDPTADSLDPAALTALGDCTVVVHLAGENIATGRWTAEKKRRIRESRVHSTRLLAESLATLEQKPLALISASAIGYYGDAAAPAREAGIRVVNVRIGVVLSDQGGALAKMLTPFRLGLGGRVGCGKQYMSWIALPDLVGAIRHAIHSDSLSGPLNSVAPAPVTNAEFTRTLGKVLGRPTLFPMPAFVARTMFGEMGDALLLSSTRVSSEKLQQSGYRFEFPDLESALRGVIG